MFKRLILSVLLLCAVVPSVRADLTNDVALIRQYANRIQLYLGSLEVMFSDSELEGWYNYRDDVILYLENLKNTIINLDTTCSDLYPYLIQQYYHVITIDDNVQSSVSQLVLVNDYLSTIQGVIEQLQSVIEDYENFKDSITIPLNNIDANNEETVTYVRAIYEDVDTIKAFFLGESNLREMLETLWDIKNELEYFQQRWEAQNTDLHEMFLDPFDNSGFQEAYQQTWEYFDRTFDPLWTWSNGSKYINVQPSNWGSLDDICQGKKP